MFFKFVEDVLNESDFEIKHSKFNQILGIFDSFEFSVDFTPKPLSTPSYAKICEILPAKDLPKYKGEDKIPAFLHSIAHIEYSAIDIALDDCYRFTGLPREYYRDFLELAGDEFRHFLMISDELAKFGYKYGDFPVHDGLFFALKNTQHSFLERMALLHRHQEAVGLDANFFMLERLKDDRAFLIPLLEVILEEEVDHVRKGDRWFRWECKRIGEDVSCFFDIVESYYPKFRSFKREINVDGRIRAGYDQKEIEELQGIMK